MSRVITRLGIVIWLGATGVAQTPSSGAAPPAGPLTAGRQMQGQYSAIKSNLTKLADRMPDEAYAFKAAPEIRTFAQGVAHTAAGNFGMCANLTGRPNPRAGVDLEKTLTAKADLVKALRESFEFCDAYMTSLTPESMAGTFKATSVRGTERSEIDVERGGLVSNLIAHNNEMYGYLSVYLRLKGIVPPSSAPRTTGRGGR